MGGITSMWAGSEPLSAGKRWGGSQGTLYAFELTLTLEVK